MKIWYKILIAIALLATLAYAEYRYIMISAHPYVTDNTICIEVFGNIDEYDYN